MQHEDFRNHELQRFQRWVEFTTEGSDAHVFGDRKQKYQEGEAAVEFYERESPIYAVINAFMVDGYKVDNDRLQSPENKQIYNSDTD